jgi:hypothetical protein
MSIPAIAKAVGAKQVIYVDLIKSSIDVAEGEAMVRGSMDAAVRVVDAGTGQTRWPIDALQGWPINVQTPFLANDEKTNESDFRRRMHEVLAIKISHLFYDWLDDFEASDIGKN